MTHRPLRVMALVPVLVLCLVVLALLLILDRRSADPGAPGRPSPPLGSAAVASEPYTRRFAIFGTHGSVKFWAPLDLASRTSDEIIRELQAVHDMVNVFDDESELSRLNAAAYGEPFKCSPKLWRMLAECRQAYRVTNGAFDVSVGPLMHLWGFHRKRLTLPDASELAEARAAVGLAKVHFDDVSRSVRFTHPATYLDFGGMAKGYGLDLSADIVRAAGIRRGLIDLGGNVICLDQPPPGRDSYSIGVRDPFNTSELLEVVSVLGEAVATSGNYERFVEIEGRRITHILDPRTGEPVPDVAGVTVITPRGIDSDVLSTAIFVGGDGLVDALGERAAQTSVLVVSRSDDGERIAKRRGPVWEAATWQGPAVD